MKYFTVLLFVAALSINTVAQTWTQLGNDIDGEADHDWSGKSLSLSSDGSILAIGAIGNDGIGSDAGHVRVFEYSAGAWGQLGNDIDGENAGDESGLSVSLNSAGNIIAIGAGSNDGFANDAGHVRIFEYSAGSWIQKGNDIEGDSIGSFSGFSVSLSDNGLLVAIGSTTGTGPNYGGKVKVFEFVGSSWVQKGNDMNGDALFDMFGHSVSLSADGMRVLACSGSGTGYVKAFAYNATNSQWEQIGSTINGEGANDFSSGASVSLSSNGTTIAIGAPDNDGTGTDAGHARIYRYNGLDWTQLGADIDGEAAYDKSGCSVSLSANGDVIAIGAKRNCSGATFSGNTRIFKYINSSWTLMGSSINGEAASDESGSAVSVNSDGTIVAIGAELNDAAGSNRGHVRVFNNTFVGIEDNIMNVDLLIYPNPSNGKFFIETSNTNNSISKCVIYNSIGAIIIEQTLINGSNNIDISEYTEGIYFIKITNNNVSITEKIIIE